MMTGITGRTCGSMSVGNMVTLSRYKHVHISALIGRCLLTGVSSRIPPGDVTELQDAAGTLGLHDDPVYQSVLR